MPRNLEKKREYDRNRYAKLREENLGAVREAERIRKEKQRKRQRDPHSWVDNHPSGSSLSDQEGLSRLEQDTARGVAQLV